MTQEHPITPPPELVKKWIEDWAGAQMNEVPCGESMEIATQAARWGADQELEACCEWLISNQNPRWAAALQEGRRPKPKSQAEEALEALEAEDDDRPLRSLKTGERFDTIRRALERLRELEGSND